MIMILAAVFLLFANSSNTMRYRGSECSARKSNMGKKDDREYSVVSARAADAGDEDPGEDPGEEEDAITNVTTPFDFVPLSKEGVEQFSNMVSKAKPATDIKKLEASLRADTMEVESSMARWRGMEVTGTIASCSGASKPAPPRPTKDSMFMLPAAFS